jgi:hypothetical protein
VFVAAIVALIAFRTPVKTLAVAGGKGLIWPPLLLHQVTKQAGAYAALRQGINHFSRNELFIIPPRPPMSRGCHCVESNDSRRSKCESAVQTTRMNPQVITTLSILAAAIVLLLWNRVPAAMAAVGTSLALYFTGILTANETLGVFGDPHELHSVS